MLEFAAIRIIFSILLLLLQVSFQFAFIGSLIAMNAFVDEFGTIDEAQWKRGQTGNRYQWQNGVVGLGRRKVKQYDHERDAHVLHAGFD